MLAEADQIIVPWEAVHSPVTQDCYMRRARQFLVFAGYMDPKLHKHKPGPSYVVEAERRETNRAMIAMIQAGIADSKKLKIQVIAFTYELRKRMDSEDGAKRIKPGQARNLLKPIKLALDMNEVVLPWKKMMRLIPSENRSQDREYTVEELRMILQASSLHLRVAELFMASSGMRVGAFDFINVGNLEPIEIDGKLACGLVHVYAGEGDDEYVTLISKEAYLTFLDYVESRKAAGEVIGPDSPLIMIRSLKHRMSSKAIGKCINDTLWKVGLRKEKKRRHEVQMDHGFRKFYDNVAKDYIREEYVEKLLGHDTGVKEHYDRRLPKPLIEQYLKAMPYLSIDSAYRAEAELSQKLEEQQKQHASEWNEVRLENLELKERQREADKRMKDMEVALITLKGVLEEIKSERLKSLGEPARQ